MSKLSHCLVFLLMAIPHFALADLISPEMAQARDRLKANPNLFDRYDRYCADKRPGDACTIPGNTLAGGGNGKCNNEINARLSTIDLTCERAGIVKIDRKLPAGGFVNDESLCRAKAKAATEVEKKETEQWNCAPLQPVPADRFCVGKAVGSSCTVELVYWGNTEHNEGICKTMTEVEGFYYQGRRVAKREVIRCEPDQIAPHEYTPVNWWQKLKQ